MVQTYKNQKYFPEKVNPVIEDSKGNKTFDETNHPLILLYGANALKDASSLIIEINNQSNINLLQPQLFSVGVGFATIQAERELKGEEPFPSKTLKALLNRAFGEASTYMQCSGAL